MLDALALVLVQVLLDLALVVLALIDGNADLAAGRGERTREQAGLLSLDAEVANFPEIKQLLVKAGPHIHIAALDVVREMIDANEPHRWGGPRSAHGHEVDIVDGALAVAIHEVDEAAADADDRRNVQFHGTCGDGPRFRTQVERTGVRQSRIGDAKCHGAGAGPMGARELLCETVMFRIDDEIDIALIVQGHVLGAMARNRRQPHAFEQPAQQFSIRCRVLDEFESVGAHGVAHAELGIHGAMTALLCAEMVVPNTRSQSGVVTPKLPRFGEWWCRMCQARSSLK